MASWSTDDLHRIAQANELHVAPLREDGVTYRSPTTIWSVVVEQDVYIRGFNGLESRWYQAALRHGAGRVCVAGLTWDVDFEPVAGAVNDRIDAAYRAKYSRSSYLAPMIGAGARSATIRVLPRNRP